MDGTIQDHHRPARLRILSPGRVSVGALEDAARRRGWTHFHTPSDSRPQSAFTATESTSPEARSPSPSLHEFLRQCGSLGWRFEPVVGPLFWDVHGEIVARHGGTEGWMGLAVVLSSDRQSVAAVHWVGGGEMLTPPTRQPIPSATADIPDWILLFTSPALTTPVP